MASPKYACAICGESKKAKSFSQNQLKKVIKKCRPCIKLSSTKRCNRNRICGRRKRNTRKNFRNFFEGCVDTGMRSSACTKCNYCGDAITLPTLHIEGDHSLLLDCCLGGDCPVQCWYCGKGKGKGSPLYQCPCEASRRHLEQSVACLETCETYPYQSYNDISEMYDEWLEMTGTEDTNGNKKGNVKELLHFGSQQFKPKLEDLPKNLMLPLRHIGMA